MRHLCEHTSLMHLTTSCGLSTGINILPGFWHIIWVCGLSTSAANGRDFTLSNDYKSTLTGTATEVLLIMLMKPLFVVSLLHCCTFDRHNGFGLHSSFSFTLLLCRFVCPLCDTKATLHYVACGAICFMFLRLMASDRDKWWAYAPQSQHLKETRSKHTNTWFSWWIVTTGIMTQKPIKNSRQITKYTNFPNKTLTNCGQHQLDSTRWKKLSKTMWAPWKY